MIDVEQWAEIRRTHFVDGVSIREIRRRTGLHRETIRRALSMGSPWAISLQCPTLPRLLMDVRGKAILSDGGPAVLGQLSVDAADVAKNLDAEIIPADIKTFLADVVSLAT